MKQTQHKDLPTDIKHPDGYSWMTLPPLNKETRLRVIKSCLSQHQEDMDTDSTTEKAGKPSLQDPNLMPETVPVLYTIGTNLIDAPGIPERLTKAGIVIFASSVIFPNHMKSIIIGGKLYKSPIHYIESARCRHEGAPDIAINVEQST